MFKKAMVVAPPSAEFEAVIREPLEKALSILWKIGFDGVEISLLNPKNMPAKQLEKLLDNYNLEIPAFSTGLNYIHYKYSLSHPNVEKRKAAISRLKEFIDLAEPLEAGVIVGLMRGKVEPEFEKEKAYNLMLESLREVCNYAEARKVKILFEPLNRYETELVNTVDEAIKLVDELGTGALYLLLDTFHMNIEEPSIEQSIKKAGELIGHIHVADSNRYAPGLGHINFVEVLKALKEVGYSGYLSAEIIVKPDLETAAKITKKTLEKVEKIVFRSS